MPSGRARWYADVLSAGLATKTLNEQDILSHVTPAVLAGAMPKDVMVRVFDAALATGSISPQVLVQTVTPELLAEHVAPTVVWACISTAAERAGLTDSAGGKPKDDASAREFLRRALQSGIAHEALSAKDIVEQVNAQVLGHLPDALTTKVLEASLAAGKMTPEIIVETLGAEGIAKHAPVNVVWAIFVKASEGKSATAASTSNVITKTIIAEPPPARPGTLEILDDDVASVLVDLEDSGGLDQKVIVEAHGKDDKTKKGGASKRT